MDMSAAVYGAAASLEGVMAFKQAMQTQNLQIEVARKAISMQKSQGEDMLKLLNPQHLGQRVDLKA